MSVSLIKDTLGKLQEHIETKKIDSRDINLSEKVENIYNQSDVQLYQGCDYKMEVYLVDLDKCIIAEGLKDIEDYLLTLADDED